MISNELLRDRTNRQVGYWLLLCAFVIFLMILLGGVTRLTHSGLSMVEWKPLVGVIPPLSEDMWMQEFDKYKAYPEFKKINHWMGLSDFKKIYFFEYAHRVLGRLIGLLFFVPFIVFLAKKKISKESALRYGVIFFLGALQGLLGWYMVKSGLVDNPMVSQYRLTAHLGLAVLIYGLILWEALRCLLPGAKTSLENNVFSRSSFVITGLIFLMILSGGLVAGTRAGYAYPTFPLMGDSLIPDHIYATSPFWLAIFEDITTIQFNHRVFAYFIVVFVICFSVFAMRSVINRIQRKAVVLLLVAVLVQVGLGVSTLLLHIPIWLGVLHQAGAVVLFSCAIYTAHCFSKERLS